MDLHVSKSRINTSIEKKDATIEAIRCVALFLVLFTHTGDYGSKLYQKMNETNSLLYFFSMSLDVIRISSVPLFLMISGAVLLGKNESVLTIIKKRILRFSVVLLIFSAIQYTYSHYVYNTELSINNFFKKIFVGEIKGEYWYLYLYLAYLLLLPIIRPVAQRLTKTTIVYLVLLSTFVDIMGMIGEKFGKYCMLNNYISFLSCYSFIFPILGYGCYNILSKRRLFIHERITLIISWIFVVIVNTYLTYISYLENGIYSENQIWRLNVLLTMPVFCILLDLGKQLKIPEMIRKIVCCIGNACFGIYLMENFIERYSSKFLSLLYMYSPYKLTNCFLYLIVTILGGTIFINLLKKIPIISKTI